ncbi:MAG: hypothetical protein IEMM0007_0287 [bacterium]|nr:MAG: hypothetical protein IEMM0007_0287 [bacterium]
MKNIRRDIYYFLKPFIPRRLQIVIRRKIIAGQRLSYSNIWPVDEGAAKPPEGWAGWPDNRQFAVVLTHDVETAIGHDKCRRLMKVEQDAGFRSSFNFVPERYEVSADLRHHIVSSGFEVGVHDLNHDGKLYKSEKIFRERAARINHYLKEWNATGFRSGSMHRNLDWIHALNIEYDASTFDADPCEPWSEGIKTIFPFIVTNEISGKYVELPYTISQDFTLFVLMKEKNIDIWKRKLDWIAEHGGMALLTTHPDYMNFDGKKLGIEEYPAEYYKNFLDYIKAEYDGKYWHVLPKDMACFWSNHAQRTRI